MGCFFSLGRGRGGEMWHRYVDDERARASKRGQGGGRRVCVRTIQIWRRASAARTRRRRVSPGSEIGVWDKGSGRAPVGDLLGRFR